MKPYYSDESVTLYHGDCLDVLRQLPDCSVDAVVCDPPYGLGFMGKEWDSGKSFVERKPAKRNTFDHVGGNHNPSNSADAARTRRSEARKFGEWCELWTAECLRVLKPGGHLLAFGGTRTWHRLACAVEDAGFEVRDSIAWLYGSGFPKALNLVDEDGQRTGWSTALKPAFEPVVVARKPMAGTVAANVTTWGTGALNIDATRIGSGDDRSSGGAQGSAPQPMSWGEATGRERPTGGRWPANVVLDESQADALGSDGGPSRFFTVVSSTLDAWEPHGGRSTRDASTSAGRTPAGTVNSSPIDGSGSRPTDQSRPATTSTTGTTIHSTTNSTTCNCSRLNSIGSITVEIARTTPSSMESSTGAASDATPCSPCQSSQCDERAPIRATAETASASISVSGESPTESATTPTCVPIDGLAERFLYQAKAPKSERPRTPDGTAHPTVKPLALMRWLVRLVTPPGGVVLEPFAGSGTTVEACILEGFDCIAIEREADYLPLIEARIARATPTTPAPVVDLGLLAFIEGEATA